ncbi:CarboxypepD_reg-like domain-containing protein [Tangfeifania diversioriginum]|uniref:CarboxypepD_reg-like domain-containing protein n=1 Tax=Tangfeifania diversioriginum TaxID=1168035 RepID=A0A1M6IP53_9BACT|nr:carboxypeptidase-like regulatory domain-containing protein [Tangfeifania diversioriginum]SHJ36241.1 CarboxypepD_reg-like domain-containing protein [Tangfeifania diversioriginum]
MKKLLFATLIVFLAFVGNAEEKKGEATADTNSEVTTVLTGTVADSGSGELLTGVEIQLEGTDMKTYTDFDGKFTFKVKPGEYKIVTNYISYNKTAETLQVENNENCVNIKLENSK